MSLPKYISPVLCATAALGLNFWAWAILSPLATQYARQLSLNPSHIAIAVATPIIIGSLGRIMAGALTDLYGGRLVFSLACMLAAIPVLSLIFIQSYMQLLVTTVLLGISGTTFAIGIPYLSGWLPESKRGLYLGLFSMGNAGTAVSGLLTPQLATIFGPNMTFALIASLLVMTGILFYRFARNAPGWKPDSNSSAFRGLKLSASRLATWDMAAAYGITFGAFVAFSMYLSVLLEFWYQLSPIDAAARAAGFILLATGLRPLGGWLSDRMGGQRTILVCLAIIAVLAIGLAFQSQLSIAATVLYLSLAAILGCGSGAVIAHVSKIAPPENMGSTVGLVGAFGALGGFLPLLVIGASYELTKSYQLSLLLLSAATLCAFVYLWSRFRHS